MTLKDARQRIEKLRTEIEHHRYLYHVEDRQEISEAALDSLKRELVELERTHPQFVTPDSPSQRVAGSVLPGFSKVTHLKPVLSLEDAFSLSDLEEWQQRNTKLLKQPVRDYYCELKFDGLTVVLTYEEGIFVRGTTRGDGRVGEDVTQNLRTIDSIPLRLDMRSFPKAPRTIEVRGEVVMTKKNFERLNASQQKRGLPLFANPRNVAAGSIRQLDSTITAARKLECYTFELITDCGQTTHEQSHAYMAQLGFKTSRYNQRVASLENVNAYLTSWQDKRKTLPYNTDGAVVVVNDIGHERVLGSVGKSDRWMIAYKFPAEQATTRVLDIIVQVGRTGALTPVAVLEPVLLAGTTVSRATLHNADEIARLDIRIGDTVILQKAGDIIPDVVQVLPKLRTGREKPYRFPKTCPICGSAVRRSEDEVAYYCVNKKCYAQELERLVHFVSKKGFDIDGLGEMIVGQLVDSGLVRDASDLFRLTIEDLIPLERFADTSAHNVIKAIDKAKRVTFEKFLYALGIRHVGEGTARQLAKAFHSLSALAAADLERLESVPDIGSTVAQSIVDWFKDPHNMRLLKLFDSVGVRVVHAPMTAAGPLSGTTFVLTGSLAEPRDVIATKIRKAGGTVVGSVSAKTDYVVAGDDPGSKASRARQLGIAVITGDELEQLLTHGR